MEVDCLDDIKKSDDFENQKRLIIYFGLLLLFSSLVKLCNLFVFGSIIIK